MYILKGGITWRMLPSDFPPWKTVYDYFSKWNKQEEKSLESVKTQYASEEHGIDGGRKVKGHKRHILVDTLGNLLHISVHAANLSDTKSACHVLEHCAEKYPLIQVFSGDAGYRGTAVKFVNETLNMILHSSIRIKDGWTVLPKRWVVERTFAWLNNFRRLAKNFEILTGTAENMVRIAMLKLMVAKCV